jgi:hypothetical protein
MRRTITSVVALLTVLSFLVGPLALAQDNDLKPEIFVPQLRHDFGKVFEQEKYVHDFVVKNRGKADLIIERVKPG